MPTDSCREPLVPNAPHTTDVNDMLARLADARGTARASDVLDSVVQTLMRQNSWRVVDQVLRRIQDMATAGHFTSAERFYLISAISFAGIGERLDAIPRFAESFDEMMEIADRHDPFATQRWLVEPAPEEYERLRDENELLMAQEESSWFSSLGETEMAYLRLHEPHEFSDRCEAGKREFVGKGVRG